VALHREVLPPHCESGTWGWMYDIITKHIPKIVCLVSSTRTLFYVTSCITVTHTISYDSGQCSAHHYTICHRFGTKPKLITGFHSSHLKKVLDIFFFGSQICNKPNKHVHFTQKFYKQATQEEVTSNNCQLKLCSYRRRLLQAT
jgi:hypothetical protein